MNCIQVKRLAHGHNLPLPNRASALSAGFDVAAAISDPLTIPPLHRAIIETGICIQIPKGYEVQIRSRSGLAAKHGVCVLNSPGTIDADYRGEIKIILQNNGQDPFVVQRGDRIAQAVIAKVETDFTFSEVDQLNDTERGSGGFGSSGR